MSLFDQIQSSVSQEDTSLNTVLLQLRLLANHLDSEPMAQWVRAELEGYASDDVPQYRVVTVEYMGTFFGPFGSGYQNAPIPSTLVEKIAGEHWTRHKLTQSISEIGQLAKSVQSGGHIQLRCSDLILLLQGKIYPGYNCNGVVGVVPSTKMVNILDIVRSKVLDLTFAMEKADPNVREVEVGNVHMPSDAVTTKMDDAFYQTVHGGNITNNIFYLPELERIVVERINASGCTDSEKKRLLEQVKTVGVQEIVKQVIQKGPDLIGLLSSLPA